METFAGVVSSQQCCSWHIDAQLASQGRGQAQRSRCCSTCTGRARQHTGTPCASLWRATGVLVLRLGRQAGCRGVSVVIGCTATHDEDAVLPLILSGTRTGIHRSGSVLSCTLRVSYAVLCRTGTAMLGCQTGRARTAKLAAAMPGRGSRARSRGARAPRTRPERHRTAGPPRRMQRGRRPVLQMRLARRYPCVMLLSRSHQAMGLQGLWHMTGRHDPSTREVAR